MWSEIDPVAYMQAQIARLYRERHGLTIEEFLELDREADILGLIEIAYEPFHLMGDEGILREIDGHCEARLGRKAPRRPRIN